MSEFAAPGSRTQWAEGERISPEAFTARKTVEWTRSPNGRCYGIRIAYGGSSAITADMWYDTETENDSPPTHVQINMFQVDEPDQGHGIGEALLRALVVETGKYGAHRFVGDLVSESALRTRARVFGKDTLTFADHTGQPIPIGFDDAVRWVRGDSEVDDAQSLIVISDSASIKEPE